MILNLPDRAVCRVIRYYSLRVPDPLERLRFLRFCTAIAQRNRYLCLRRPFHSWVYRLMFLDSLANTPQVRRQSMRVRDRVCLWLFRRRNELVRHGKSLLITAMGAVVALSIPAVPRRKAEPSLRPTVAAPDPSRAPADGQRSFAGSAKREVWLVESEGEDSLYSNGLKIADSHAAHTAKRFFPVLVGTEGTYEQVEWSQRPEGIVFHTTESDPAPWDPTNNQRIRYQGRQLIGYIQRNRLYNFVIDRFGRVFRIVPEEEYANHAGNSLWAAGGRLYVNLNQSFLGVALEAALDPTPTEPGGQGTVTPAQLVSARLLTEMLCGRLGIAHSNVVTHEMASVNPETMRIGYHTDWKGLFPFEALNLPDNYQVPLASMVDWGFRYDARLVQDLGGRVWPGLRLSETMANRQAEARGLPFEQYRAARERQYRQILSRLARLRPPARHQAGTGSTAHDQARRPAP